MDELQKKPQKKRFFHKYWVGEEPLFSSVFAVWLPVAFVVFVFKHFARENFFGLQASVHPIVLWIAVVALSLGLGAICIWTCVGLWRSAGNYIKLNRDRFVSFATVCFTSIINIAGAAYVAQLFIFTVAPEVGLITKYALFGYLLVSPFSLHIASNGSEVSIKGGIRYGLSEKVESLLSTNRGIETLALESDGGSILEAEKLSHVIFAHNLNTVVNERCISECVLSFAGGRNRWLGLTGYLGFSPRSLFIPLTRDAREERVSEFKKQYQNVEQPMDLLLAILFQKKVEVLYPSRDDLLLFNYLTNKRSEAASSKTISDQFFSQYIQAQKRSLPAGQDDYTSLVDCEARDGRIRLIFVLSDEKFNAVKSNHFEYELLKEKVTSSACDDKKVKAGVNAGVNYSFAYLKSSARSESIEFEVNRCDR